MTPDISIVSQVRPNLAATIRRRLAQTCARAARWSLAGCVLVWGYGANAATVTVLHSFDGTDGGRPGSRLVEGSDGNFYGTTPEEGSNGCGTIFKMTPSGTLTVLHSFGSQPDGCFPTSGLVEGKDGNFYGTTSQGGAPSPFLDDGLGTIYRISPTGEFAILHSFGPNSRVDGLGPLAALILGSDGNLYGTTSGGGEDPLGPILGRPGGTVFRIKPNGDDFTVLHTFLREGADNEAGGSIWALVEGPDGNLYGTTTRGGVRFTSGNHQSCGTVFRISKNSDYQRLHAFTCFEDGRIPSGPLVVGNDGNLYGMAKEGGVGRIGKGVMFRITPAGDFLVLNRLPEGQSVANPQGGLTLGKDGKFYGTAGRPFTMTAEGVVTAFFDSDDETDNAWTQIPGPVAAIFGLIFGRDGNLYGTSNFGGSNKECAKSATRDGVYCGAVFRIELGSSGGNPAASLQFVQNSFKVKEAGGRANLRVSRTLNSTGIVTVKFRTATGSAAANQDFRTTSGTLTWPDGDLTTKTITVPITSDTLDERDESFNVELSSPSGIATLGTSNATVVIVDDDTGTVGPGITMAGASIAEGNSGIVNLRFKVQLSASATGQVKVSFATQDGTAKKASDYVANSGTLTFSVGQMSKDILIQVKGDTAIESNETLKVILSKPVGATITTSTATGTIRNDDRPQLRINDVRLTEGNGGQKTASFTVRLSAAATGPVKVNFATADGTAKKVQDYVATSGSLTLTSGQTSRTIQVRVRGDATKESNETFLVNLSNATGAAIADRQGVGTITNDD